MAIKQVFCLKDSSESQEDNLDLSSLCVLGAFIFLCPEDLSGHQLPDSGLQHQPIITWGLRTELSDQLPDDRQVGPPEARVNFYCSQTPKTNSPCYIFNVFLSLFIITETIPQHGDNIYTFYNIIEYNGILLGISCSCRVAN